jgi:hypothetical protein
MCYGDPDKLLELVIGKRGLPKNDLGHTPLDDFEHFCAYSGCNEDDLGPRAFAFVRTGYVTAALGRGNFRRVSMGADLKRDCANIAMLLRDRPLGTTADITAGCALYWDGNRLTGARLSGDEPGDVAEPFEVEDFLPEARDAVSHWLAHPSFTFRPSLLEWLDAPAPRDVAPTKR